MALALSRRPGEEIRIFCGDDVSDEEILAAVRGEGLAVRVDGVYTSLSRPPMKDVMVRLSIRAPRCIEVLRNELIDRSRLPGI
jgi:sRNA-binding carbon storage regulator CsrA